MLFAVRAWETIELLSFALREVQERRSREQPVGESVMHRISART